MLFNSYAFLLFFPVVVLVYYLLPKKAQNIWLLIASYYFYMNWDAKYALLLLFSTTVTYGCGLLIENYREHAKLFLTLSFFVNLSILFVFKYLTFALDCLNGILSPFGLAIPNPSFHLLLPVGISFYIFQALGYTMDVYRKEICAEKRFLHYALFVSFFPQLVAGPIERSKNLLGQLATKHTFSYENLKEGFVIMLWGYFQKVVVADRIAIFVDRVYANYETYSGVYVIVAAFLFPFQIYCDFAGYSTIALGAAKILGIDLMRNFRCPYFASSIKDFWRRWHISLSTWFRDYLYIPLGGNRVSRRKGYRNILIVFLISGLWHGANLTFVIWGMLHGVFQVVGSCLQPLRNKVRKILHISETNVIVRAGKILVTFLLVAFAWVFFRADSIQDAVQMIQSMLQADNFEILKNGALYEAGLNHRAFVVMLFSIFILIVSDFLETRNISLTNQVIHAPTVVRYVCCLGMLAYILIFGVWGSSYDAASFIYFQF